MRRAPSRLKQLTRVLLTGLGLLCVLLGFIGAFLPLVPSTPFLIVAAWGFSRSNPRLYRRLRQQHLFGPALRDWQAGRGMSVGTKVAAVVSITLTFGLSIGFVVERPIIKFLLAFFAVGLVTYLLRQPTSRPLHLGEPRM